ncbi:MAG: hypothetical protein AB1649_16665 [Chloroflexota bacterium]
MNLRCFYCQTPFTLGRAEILTALQYMDAENMNHYDAHCPRCRRANSVARQRLEMFMPNWREVAAEQAAMPAPASAPTTVMPPAPAVTAPSEEPAPKANKSSHRRRAGSAKAAVARPAAKAAKKPAPARAKPATKSTTDSKAKKTTTKDKKK